MNELQSLKNITVDSFCMCSNVVMIDNNSDTTRELLLCLCLGWTVSWELLYEFSYSLFTKTDSLRNTLMLLLPVSFLMGTTSGSWLYWSNALLEPIHWISFYTGMRRKHGKYLKNLNPSGFLATFQNKFLADTILISPYSSFLSCQFVFKNKFLMHISNL